MHRVQYLTWRAWTKSQPCVQIRSIIGQWSTFSKRGPVSLSRRLVVGSIFVDPGNSYDVDIDTSHDSLIVDR